MFSGDEASALYAVAKSNASELLPHQGWLAKAAVVFMTSHLPSTTLISYSIPPTVIVSGGIGSACACAGASNNAKPTARIRAAHLNKFLVNVIIVSAPARRFAARGPFL
jgi:hypothetical protein